MVNREIGREKMGAIKGKINVVGKCGIIGLSLLLTVSLFPVTGFAEEVPGEICLETDNLIEATEKDDESDLSGTVETNGTTIIQGYYSDSDITEAIIPEGTTIIGEGAFGSCHNLEKVVIPDSVVSIGAFAFYGCSSLKQITIPDSVTSIGREAFAQCGALTEITLSSGLTCISGETFFGCRNLKEIIIPDSVTSIEAAAFEQCSGLEKVVLPKKMASLELEAFCGCSSLREITLPEGITSIGDETFECCSSLQEIIIPESVTSIGGQAFLMCSGLTEVIIPCNVTSIDFEAFANCENLKRITIPDSVVSIGGGAFAECNNLTIYGNKESYAKTYARENNIPFVSLNGEQNVEAVSLNKKSATISFGKTLQLKATVIPSDADNKNVTWKSSNKAVATVSSSGKVTAKGVGTATIKVTTKDGAKTAKCKITVTKPLSKTKIKLAHTSLIYNGTSRKPAVIVKDGLKSLKKNTDFTVKYTKNKNVGTSTVTITGKGLYTGSVKKTFKIVPKGTSITSLNTGEKSFTVNWKKQATQTTGYQVQYSLKKDYASGNKTVTLGKISSVSKKIGSLKSGKTYYVRVRTYKTVSGKKYYSGWSKIKSIKTE